MPDTRPSTAQGSADLAGSVVGSYRITNQLSTGGMGAVYRAEHELLGKAVAVKLLRPELCASQEMVERFFNEARAATAIRHPGIVEVFDFGFHADGRAYLVMEFLDGEPLSARLARVGLSEIQAAVITRGIASALGAAHAMGIIHRDLKPDNVFLVPDPDMPNGERPKVLDFGIAKLAEDDNRRISHTRTGALMGTPMYMAPEQARAAASIDPRADLYSLGCMLYEMLTGAPPFVAEGAGEIISLQLFAAPELPSARAAVSPEMERIVMRLLEKDPADRFQLASEVIDALSSAIPTLSGRMSAVVPASTGRRQALIVPTQHGTELPRTTIGAQPMLTPLPLSPGPARRRSVAPAVIAGIVTLGIAAAVVAFLVFHHPARTVEPAPAPVTVVKPPPDNVVTPPAPADISYFLELTPHDAVVEVDGVPVELHKGFFTAPSRPDRHNVTVNAPGYQEANIPVEGNMSESRKVVLTRLGDSHHPSVDKVVASPTHTPDHDRSSTGSGTRPQNVQSTTGTAPAEAHDVVTPAVTQPHDQPPKNPDVGKTTEIGDHHSRIYNSLDDDPAPPKHD